MQTHLKTLTAVKSPRGFLVVPIHYKHDPDKDEDWEISERAKYPTEAEASRELDFDTRQVLGSPAYPNFARQQHLITKYSLAPDRPLLLSCDFNVDPCVWNISQIIRNKLFTFDEIFQRDTDVPLMMDEFLNRYPDHPGDIYVYGDATGDHRSANNRHSCYTEMRMAFRAYPSHVHWKYTKFNPAVRDRISAVNNRLKNLRDGSIDWYIHASCVQLIGDLEEVVTDQGGNGIHKSRKREDPYYMRTHASDGIGYLIAREWPILRELAQVKRDRHKRHTTAARRYARVIGAI